MNTEVLKLDPARPAPDVIARAAAVLRAGGLVAFPTETVYGLGANALDATATSQIFVAKGRPSHNPLIVHLADANEIDQLAAGWPEAAARLAARFWPGPLTLVLPKRPAVPDVVTAGGPTVAVRIPAHPVAQALLKAARVPIAAPSANASNHISATRAEHVLKGLGGRIPLILDGGPTAGGLESTVLDVTCNPPRLLRPGLVSPSEIEAVIGKIAVGPASSCEQDPLDAESEDAAKAVVRSPGMLARHYAPSVPLECIPAEDLARLEALRREHRRIGWLCFGPAPAGACGLSIIEMPTQPDGYAAHLYAALHSLESAGVE
ncbi:MAG TPA: L-threonylcarbamoyladenylate synthase, partial [Pirellulales bacterium]|nr:L-threonylcarbamoyladenylate synthase [Pirellulales bacterium]